MILPVCVESAVKH